MYQDIRPKWWQLYLTLPLLVGLFLVDFRLGLSTRGHQIVQIGIVLFVYTLVHLWLKANGVPLSKMDAQRTRVIITIIQVPHPNESKKQPLFQLPESGIKGVLSDTFEMDIAEAEIFSMNEVSQGYQKE
jgi:hypothetical protein